MSDRETANALVALAAAATPGKWRVHTSGGSHPTDMGTEWWSEVAVLTDRGDTPDDVVCQLGEGEDSSADAAFIAASRSETPWLARRLLEALDTIDIAGSLHHAATPDHAICVTCGTRWPCPTWLALNPTPEHEHQWVKRGVQGMGLDFLGEKCSVCGLNGGNELVDPSPEYVAHCFATDTRNRRNRDA